MEANIIISLLEQISNTEDINEQVKLSVRLFQTILDNFVYMRENDICLNTILNKTQELAEIRPNGIEPEVYQYLLNILQKTADAIKEYWTTVGGQPCSYIDSLLVKISNTKDVNERAKLTINMFRCILNNFVCLRVNNKFLDVVLAKTQELVKISPNGIEPEVYQQLLNILQKTADTIKEYRMTTRQVASILIQRKYRQWLYHPDNIENIKKFRKGNWTISKSNES